jgi:hypothetical protein
MELKFDHKSDCLSHIKFVVVVLCYHKTCISIQSRHRVDYLTVWEPTFHGAGNEGKVLLYSPVQRPNRPKKQRRSKQGE